MRRVLAICSGGAVGLALLVGVTIGWDTLGPPVPPPEIRPAPIVEPDWKITRRYSVNRVLIIEGECADRERAVEIAKSYVGLSTESYDEVLVYVKASNDRTRTRRVQWTKKDGYRVLDF